MSKDNLVHMSHVIRKLTFCVCKNKGADHIHGYRKADQRLCFGYKDSTALLSKSKFPSSGLLCLYSLVYVGPVRKLHCWFSHDVAHIKLL